MMVFSRPDRDVRRLVGLLALTSALGACGSAQTKEAGPAADAPAAVEIATATVEEEPISRLVRVTGSLTADEQAEVGAETAGRVVATPVERGSRVTRGTALVQISAAETSAQLAEAQANAAQLEARLGLEPGSPFDVQKVPEVMNAKAGLDLAEAEFGRIRSLLDQRVVSQSEYDQRRTQVEAARQQFQAAQNTAQQSFRQLEAARARVDLARKAVEDTVVRAPFDGLVVERRVSVGDYVTRGTVVATVVSIDALRVELSFPEQLVGQIKVGQSVTFSVDAYPGERFEGRVRFISPALRADQRSLTVEAIVPNQDGRLKPGLFATADVQQSNREPALLVPATALHTVAGINKVYLVNDDRVEERIVTAGQRIGDRVEIREGLVKGDVVATGLLGQLSDGARIRVK
jgi:RND family efflux transporter MFP subunit